MPVITVTSVDQLEKQFAKIADAARKAHQRISEQSDDPMQFLRSVKFEKRGYHPVDGHEINLIEQVNQTWTYTVALKATERLFKLHPEAEGFTLAPGATASQDLDIMSIDGYLVGAETFAATSPDSNHKMIKDLEKLKARGDSYKNRYVFYTSPKPPKIKRLEKYQKDYPGIEIRWLDI